MKWVRIEAADRQSITAVYEFLSGLSKEYGNFKEWYYTKVVSELSTGTRLIYSVVEKKKIVAVLILKNAEEKKICTLRVAEGYRNQGIATRLLKIAFKELECATPIITVSSYHIEEFWPLLRKNGFHLFKEYTGYYKDGITEYSFNGLLNEACGLKNCA